jgi:hypothetical protein
MRCACGNPHCDIDESKVESAEHANARARRDFVDQTGGRPFIEGFAEDEQQHHADLRDMYEPTPDEVDEILAGHDHTCGCAAFWSYIGSRSDRAWRWASE